MLQEQHCACIADDARAHPGKRFLKRDFQQFNVLTLIAQPATFALTRFGVLCREKVNELEAATRASIDRGHRLKVLRKVTRFLQDLQARALLGTRDFQMSAASLDCLAGRIPTQRGDNARLAEQEHRPTLPGVEQNRDPIATCVQITVEHLDLSVAKLLLEVDPLHGRPAVQKPRAGEDAMTFADELEATLLLACAS